MSRCLVFKVWSSIILSLAAWTIAFVGNSACHRLVELYRSCQAQSSAKADQAALESSLPTILVSLKKPPHHLTNCEGITPLHQYWAASGALLTALEVLAFHTDAGIWQSSPSFSPVTRVPGGRGVGLCDGVVPSRPRPGKDAAAGQKSSALLSVWVLLSLLPVFTWEAVGTGTGMQDKEGSGGGSEGPGGWSWCSFPKSSPENTGMSVTSQPMASALERSHQGNVCCGRGTSAQLKQKD